MALADGARTIVDLQLGGAPEPPKGPLPTSILAGGVGLVSGGGVLIGVGAGLGLHSTDKGAPKLLIAGGVMEGTAALAFGTALVMLLRRPSARAQSPTVTPWSAGRVAGVRVRF
jgi:hypothetical protein